MPLSFVYFVLFWRQQGWGEVGGTCCAVWTQGGWSWWRTVGGAGVEKWVASIPGAEEKEGKQGILRGWGAGDWQLAWDAGLGGSWQFFGYFQSLTLRRKKHLYQTEFHVCVSRKPGVPLVVPLYYRCSLSEIRKERLQALQTSSVRTRGWETLDSWNHLRLPITKGQCWPLNYWQELWGYGGFWLLGRWGSGRTNCEV